jgi:AAA+ superfamily predicted ATPase
MNDYERFEKIVSAGGGCVSIITDEEQYALDMVRSAARKFGRDFWLWSSSEGVRDGLSLLDNSPPVPNTIQPDAGLSNLGKCKPGSICATLDISEYLKSGRPLRVLRDMIDVFCSTGSTLVMIDNNDNLPAVIKSYCQPFEISYPDEKELEQIIRDAVLIRHKKKTIEVGITRKGLDIIIRNLRGLTRRQARQVINETITDNKRFDDSDINLIISNKRRMLQSYGLLEYIQTPVDLSEIGGMRNLKKWLKMRENAWSTQAQNAALNAPRGVLVLGIQGAGKSLTAKAIATAWHQPLLRLDPGTLYASFIGESERNLRDALKQAETMSPVILWIDEIEKAFASAASRSVDGGLSQRMFGSFLTWLQEHQQPVFVVATANDIEALPPELLRKGRFDEIFFVDLPTKEVRSEIFSIHLKKRNLDSKNFELDKLASLSEGFSGAEIEQAILSALFNAFSDNRALSTDDILEQLKTSPPLSVTMAEKVQNLLAWAKGRCVRAE